MLNLGCDEAHPDRLRPDIMKHDYPAKATAGAGRVRRTASLYESFREDAGVSDQGKKIRASMIGRSHIRGGQMDVPFRQGHAGVDRSNGGRLVQDEHFWACVRRIGSILGGLAIPYHFTGGLASSFYGEPRFTQDIDVVIRLSVDDPATSALLGAVVHRLLHQSPGDQGRDPAEQHLPGSGGRDRDEDRLPCR